MVLARQPEMAGHDQPRTGIEGRPERDELALGQLGIGPIDQRQLVMRIRRRVTGAGEVLGRRRDALALQTAYGGSGESPDGHGIVTEAADPEGRIGRVGGHVADRCVVHVDAEGAQLECHGARDAFSERLVAGGAECHGAREGRRVVAQSDQLPALLVARDEQGWCAGRPGRLDGGGQPAQLRRIDDVVEPEDGHARDTIVGDPLRRRTRQLVTDEGDHEPRQRHDLTEPAVIPRTKARWSARNTISGTTMVMNAPAVRRCHEPPRLPISW